MKVRIAILVPAAALLLLSCNISTQEDPVTSGDLINKVSQVQLEETIRGLSGADSVIVGGTAYTIETRATGSGEPVTRALQYVSERFSSCGLTVETHNWTSGAFSCSNISATKVGAVRSDEVVIICASLDCRPDTGPAPGADANASGCAGVLECARIMSGHTFECSIRFVLFTGTEQGLLGSSQYVSTMAMSGGETVIAVYNLKMIGWDELGGPVVRLHTRNSGSVGHAEDTALVDAFYQTVAAYSVGIAPLIDADGFNTGDHSSFWNQGYPAVCVIQDDEYDFNTYYGTEYDTADKLNMSYLTDNVRAVLGTAIGYAVLLQ